jgi:hypothetical protein
MLITLEARPESCFSSIFVLKINDLAHGRLEGRWFSESVAVQCTGRRRLSFEKVGWLGSEFVLAEAGTREPFGRAVRSGFFTRSWDLDLSTGPANMNAAGLFATAYVVQQNHETVAEVDRLGVCERGWSVRNLASLNETDLLLIGLVYHVIQERQRHQQAAAGAHGS